MKTGVIEWYSPQRGYGFITGTEGDNIFVHNSGLIDKGTTPPSTGDQVTYDVTPTSRGPKAVHSAPSAELPRPRGRTRIRRRQHRAVMAVSDRLYPHMFVDAESRFAEILCGVEFFGTLSIGRARDLAEIHDGHQADECAVLRAAQTCLKAEIAAADQRQESRKRLCKRGFGVSYSGAREFSGHDCGEDPGPICSVLIAVAMAGLTRGCDPRECRTRERVAEAFVEFGIDPEPRPPRSCVDGANAVHAGRIIASVVAAARMLNEEPITYCCIDPGPLPETLGPILGEIHHGCDALRCRAKQRAQQAITPGSPAIPVPECRVPPEVIAAAAARVSTAYTMVHWAEAALRTGHTGAGAAMITATAELGAARRHRDRLFLRAVPVDGTIPAELIARFGLSLRQVRRLVPTMTACATPPGVRR